MCLNKHTKKRGANMVCPECKKKLTDADAYGHDCEIN